MKWLSALFHCHKWATVNTASAVIERQYIVSGREMKFDVRVILQKCEKCGKERAYRTDGADIHQDMDVEFVKAEFRKQKNEGKVKS